MLHRTHNHKIVTDYYQKPTSKNRLLNFQSEHPLIQRTSMAYGTVSRILTLTSSINRESSINKIFQILSMNGYPNKLIMAMINKFDNNTNKPTKDKPQDAVPSKYRGLIYTSHLSENLFKLFNTHDPSIKIGFKPESTVRKIIKTPYPPMRKEDQHGLIYSFACNDCAGVYIGQTGQKLKNRIKQHISDRNSKTVKVNNTAAYQHSKSLNHTFDFENTRILAKENNLQKRLTLEAININLNRTKAINLKSDIDNLNPTYTQLLTYLQTH